MEPSVFYSFGFCIYLSEKRGGTFGFYLIKLRFLHSVYEVVWGHPRSQKNESLKKWTPKPRGNKSLIDSPHPKKTPVPTFSHFPVLTKLFIRSFNFIEMETNLHWVHLHSILFFKHRLTMYFCLSKTIMVFWQFKYSNILYF